MRLGFGLLVAIYGLLPAVLAAEPSRAPLPEPPRDVWHQITHISPFFSRALANLRAAAVIQSDGHFARIILGEGGSGAYVTVNLPGAQPADTLRSELVFSNGGVMSRMVEGDALETQVMTTSQSVTYSFSIAPEDIRGFRSADTWTLTPSNGAPVQITLKGSAKAIRTALSSARPLPVPLLDADAMYDPRRATLSGLPTGEP